jgi:hypothetical protein
MCRVISRMMVVLLSLAFAGQVPSAFGADGKPVKPVKEWGGSFPKNEDEKLRKEYPAGGCLASEKAWAKLWKAWRGKEELPKVDFEKQLVIVACTLGARNKIEARFKLDATGDLKGLMSATEIGGPGFVYLIMVLDRAGVKTYNGKTIGKE